MKKVNLVILINGEEKYIYRNRKGTFFKIGKDKIYVNLPIYETIVKVDNYGFCAIRVKRGGQR